MANDCLCTQRSTGVLHSHPSIFWPRLVRSTPEWTGGLPQRATASRLPFPTATCLNVTLLHFSLSPSGINMEAHVHTPVCYTWGIFFIVAALPVRKWITLVLGVSVKACCDLLDHLNPAGYCAVVWTMLQTAAIFGEMAFLTRMM